MGGGDTVVKRLIIFDLDDTLWTCDGGCVSFLDQPFRRTGEDTLVDAAGRSLRLAAGARDLLEWLATQNIVLSIASYNYPAFGRAALEALGLYHLFSFPQITVAHKDEMVRRICLHARPLGISARDMLFVDDRYSNIVRVAQLCIPCLMLGRDIDDISEVRHYLT